jgi:hypothetical protein
MRGNYGGLHCEWPADPGGCFLMLDDIRRRLVISLGYCSLVDIAPEVCYKQFYSMFRL